MGAYDAWLEKNLWTSRRADDLKCRLREVRELPLTSVVMPVYNTPARWLERAIESVHQQVFDRWELCIADDCSSAPHVKQILERWQQRDPRIKVVYRDQNGGISQATNSAADLASGEYLAFLDHDDELTPDALGEVALKLADGRTDILYSDDDKIRVNGTRYDPQFKGAYSPELLLSFMYFSHLFVLRRSLFAELGGMRKGFEGSQDYDLALRAVERTQRIEHLPMVLYHWRAIDGSTAKSGDQKPHSFAAGMKAVQEALDRRGVKARAFQPGWAKGRLGLFACEFPDDGPAVTIVVPTRNRVDLLRRCLTSLKKTSYRNYRIMVIDNESDDPRMQAYLADLPAKVMRLSCPNGRFSFAYLNNRAVAACDTEYVLLLNNDTEVVEPRWLSTMMGYAQMAGVGSVGARLLYADGQVQHAGILHGLHGLAGHAFKLMPEWHAGHMNQALCSRDVSAVTAACLLIQRQRYLQFGGLDEHRFAVAYNDVDLGYRLLRAGLRNVYCAQAVLRHHEGATRGSGDSPAEEAAFSETYCSFEDPYYSPHLSLRDESFSVQPRRLWRGERKLRRVLYVTHSLGLTGAPLAQAEIAHDLKQRHGVEAVVASPTDGPLAEQYRKWGAQVITIPQFFDEVFLGHKTYPDMLQAMEDIVRSSGADAVFANTTMTFYGAMAAERAGIGSIWMIHESEPQEYYRQILGEYMAEELFGALGLPYRVVFVSEATMRLFAPLERWHNFTCQHIAIPQDRIASWITRWTRQQARTSLGIAADEVMLLNVGTVCERKGQLDLALAYRSLPPEMQRRIRCCIVGDIANDYSRKLWEELRGWPEELKSRFDVQPETSEIGRFYQAADVFVATSRVESFPRVNLEAMQLGLPIIATPVFGVPEQVRDGVNGIHYRSGNIEELRQAITRLVDDRAYREELGAHGKLVVRSLPTSKQVADACYQMLNEAYLSRM
jgi:GT2 family glycosyltransferase